jgi:multidrug efflux pump subunit AcrA (membrane-fusion protein)
MRIIKHIIEQAPYQAKVDADKASLAQAEAILTKAQQYLRRTQNVRTGRTVFTKGAQFRRSGPKRSSLLRKSALILISAGTGPWVIDFNS